MAGLFCRFGGAEKPKQTVQVILLVEGGSFTKFNDEFHDQNELNLVRLTSAGALDTLAPGALRKPGTTTTNLVAGGKLIVAGSFGFVNGIGRTGIAQLNMDGSLDTSFNPGTGFSYNFTPVHAGNLEAMIMQPDGKIVAGGSFTMVNDVSRTGFARLNANGSLDPAFVPGMNIVGFGISAAF